MNSERKEYWPQKELFKNIKNDCIRKIIKKNWRGPVLTKIRHFGKIRGFNTWKIKEVEPLFEYHGTLQLSFYHNCYNHTEPDCGYKNAEHHILLNWKVDKGKWDIELVSPLPKSKKKVD